MKAQVLQSLDGPAGFKFDASMADPAVKNPDDVLIKVEAAGICHRDITYACGKFGGGRTPAVLGHEGAGVVVEVGSAVKDLQPGDRVVHVQFAACGECEPCRAGKPAACVTNPGAVGESFDGAFGEFMVLPRRIVAKVPEGLSSEHAAICACALGTSYHALRLYGFEPEGKTVGINGAGGGVGIHAIQVAKALGARVIATTRSAGKEAAIREAGADEVIVHDDKGYRKQIKAATDGAGVDLFMEIVGAPTLANTLLSVKRGGRVVVTGNPDGGTCVFNPALLIIRGELQMYGTLAITLPELEEVLQLAADGKIRPVIDSVAPLEELPAQMERMQRSETVGRVVLTP